MKAVMAGLCAGAFVLASSAPVFALMRGNPSNPDYKYKYNNAPPSTNMEKPAKSMKSFKKPKRP